MRTEVNMQIPVKQRPILFSTEMVRAILDGRKTMTRRIIKGQPPTDHIRHCWFDAPVYGFTPEPCPTTMWHKVRCPYGQVGDVLWVRETWKPKYIKGCLYEFQLKYPELCPWFYAADEDCEEGYGSWKPSIHMPKDAARLFLRITDIRVERLQDISEQDAIAEGIEHSGTGELGSPICYRNYIAHGAKWCHTSNNKRFTPTNSFQTLWESINGLDSWQANPWVWVVSFEIEKPQYHGRKPI